MSSKKLKLNLEHQITANDTNREEELIDNIDPSSSSSEDNDIDHEEDSCRKRFYEKRDTSYYLLLDSDILETVIQTIGRCPIENCSGKVKLKSSFSKKMGLYCNLHVLYVNGRPTFSLAKKFQHPELLISTYVRSLLFVKMEKATLGLNLYVHTLILCP